MARGSTRCPMESGIPPFATPSISTEALIHSRTWPVFGRSRSCGQAGTGPVTSWCRLGAPGGLRRCDFDSPGVETWPHLGVRSAISRDRIATVSRTSREAHAWATRWSRVWVISLDPGSSPCGKTPVLGEIHNILWYLSVTSTSCGVQRVIFDQYEPSMSRMGRAVSVSRPGLRRSVGLFQWNPVSWLISSACSWPATTTLFKCMALFP